MAKCSTTRQPPQEARARARGLVCAREAEETMQKNMGRLGQRMLSSIGLKGHKA
jgi:hypothetical protein